MAQLGKGVGLWMFVAVLGCSSSHSGSTCGDGVCDVDETGVCDLDCPPPGCDGTGPCEECAGVPIICDGVCGPSDLSICGCTTDCATSCDRCGDGICDDGEMGPTCFCDVDCMAACAPEDCGDGVCSECESTRLTCSSDCGADTRCTSVETCSGAGCPYVLDADIRCTEGGFGLHIAPGAEDAALLSFTTNVGSFTPWLARLSPGFIEVQPLAIATPSALVMSDFAGRPHLLVGEIPSIGLGYLNTTAPPLPTPEQVSATPGPSDFYLPIDGGFDGANAPQALYHLGRGAVFLANRNSGTWTSQQLSTGSLPFAPNGQALAFDADQAVAITWLSGAEGFDLWRFDSDGSTLLLEGVRPLAGLSAVDSTTLTGVSIAYQGGDGIHLVTGSGGSYADGVVPGTAPRPDPTGCPGPDEPCDCSGGVTICTETTAGLGVGQFAVVRASGKLWMAWLESSIARDIGIEGVASGVCICERSVIADRGTHTLVIAELDGSLDGIVAQRVVLDGTPSELHVSARGSRIYVAMGHLEGAGLRSRVIILDADTLMAD